MVYPLGQYKGGPGSTQEAAVVIVNELVAESTEKLAAAGAAADAQLLAARKLATDEVTMLTLLVPA
jgi:hypothetical protein